LNDVIGITAGMAIVVGEIVTVSNFVDILKVIRFVVVINDIDTSVVIDIVIDMFTAIVAWSRKIGIWRI
jgi:hypothetical protein